MPNIFSNPKTIDFNITNTTNGYIGLAGAFIPPASMVVNTAKQQPMRYTAMGGNTLELKQLYDTNPSARDLFDSGALTYTTIEGPDDLIPGGGSTYVSPLTSKGEILYHDGNGDAAFMLLDGKLLQGDSANGIKAVDYPTIVDYAPQIDALDNRVDILESSGGGISKAYMYNNEWTQWLSPSGTERDWVSTAGGGAIFGGITDYDNSATRGCLRMHCGTTLNFYAAIGMTGFTPVAGVTFSIEAKILTKSNHIGNPGVFKMFFGFSDTHILPSVSKGAFFRATITPSTKNLAAEVIGSSTMNTSAGTITNEVFNIFKVVVNGVTDIKFYKDNVLIATHNIVESYAYVPVFGIHTSVADTSGNTISPFLFQDWVEIRANKL